MIAVNVDGSALTPTTQYSIDGGVLTINQGVIQTAGSHSITIEATGFANSSVTQMVAAGEPTLQKSQWDINGSNDVIDWNNYPVPNVMTIYAKDQYENPVSGYVFNYVATVEETGDEYLFNGIPVSGSVPTPHTDLAPTDIDGKTQLTLLYPQNPQGGVTFSIYLNDNDLFVE